MMFDSSLFDPYPVDAPQLQAAAEATRGRLDLVGTLLATVEQEHRAMMSAIEGDLATSAQDAPTEVLTVASTVQQQAHYAAGCLEEFGQAVDRYNDASTQADQIEDLRETTEEYGGGAPSIITGDLNHVITDADPQGEALQDYVDDGYTDAGEDVGATSDFGYDRRIDYIFTSDELTAGDADRVQGDSPDHEGEDRDLSDHDGIVVDVDVPASADRADSPDDGGGDGSGGGGSSGSW